MAHDTVNVTTVRVLGGHRVALTFDDDAHRERDLSPLLSGPVFDDIRSNADRFAEVGIDPELGVLCWPNGVDVDAELLRYDDLWDAAVRLTDSI